MKRREMVLGAAVAGAAAVAGWPELFLRRPLPPGLQRAAGGIPGPRAPGRTGVLDAASQAVLWRLATRLVHRFGIESHVALDEPGLTAFIHEKTLGVPSYLTEYRSAARLVEALERDRALDRLFAPAPPASALGRAQRFVVAELVELALARGGFRAFGWRNFRGWAGGPLADRTQPPYRSHRSARP